MPAGKSSGGFAAEDEGTVATSALSVDRITIALVQRAGEDLRRLQERTRLSKTDLVNRAITLYEFIDAQLRFGRDLLVRDPATGETQTILIL